MRAKPRPSAETGVPDDRKAALFVVECFTAFEGRRAYRDEWRAKCYRGRSREGARTEWKRMRATLRRLGVPGVHMLASDPMSDHPQESPIVVTSLAFQWARATLGEA